MEINYKKLSVILVIINLFTLTVIVIMNLKKVEPSESYNELTRQNEKLTSKNIILSKEIDSLKRFNLKIDSIISKLDSQKTIIKYEFIEKTKEIDNGSVSYLIDEYKIIFSKNNIR